MLDAGLHRGPADSPEVVVTGSTVCVVIGTDGSGKRPIPERLLAALVAESDSGPS